MRHAGARASAFTRGVAVAAGAVASCVSSAAHAQGAMTYEVRDEIAGMLFPTQDYPIKGSCATGSGVAPASLYASGSSGRGFGLGAALGLRAGYQIVINTPDGSGRTWWGGRVGLGLDIGLLYTRTPSGLTDTSGELCARIRSDGSQVQYQSSSMLLAQFPFFIGTQFGVGTQGGGDDWRGVVLGAAWAPAITYLKPWDAGGQLNLDLFGTELTLDFASLRNGTPNEAAKRIALYLLVPVENRAVTAFLSFGLVWH
jgi:hypothetical protein